MPTACVAASATKRPRQTMAVQTTLYDLVASINATIEPEDDHLVTAEVLRLLEDGRATFLRR